MDEGGNQRETTVILTASGGGGILQAAMAKKQQILAKNPYAHVVTIDVMLQWMGIVGFLGMHSWNHAQKKGRVGPQIILGKLQYYSDKLFWSVFFIRMLYFLMTTNVSRVIDTQPMGTSAILKAIRLVNYLKKRNVVLEKVLSDLPTKASTHFYQGIKPLSQKDKKCFRLITIEPLLEHEPDAKSFWQKYCGITENEVQYEDFFIRKGFMPYLRKQREHKPYEIIIRTENDHENHYVEKTCSKGCLSYYKDDIGYRFVVMPHDKLFVVLLGSQPCFEATSKYVKNFIHLIKAYGKRDKRYHLFVFCSKFRDSKKNLFKNVYKMIEEDISYPKNLTVIPMSFQDSESIAAIFHRSDIAITRSGGQTIMELMGVACGEKWVHSEAKVKGTQSLTREQLLKGIPAWEAGCAVYLVKKSNGKLITPDILVEKAKTYL